MVAASTTECITPVFTRAAAAFPTVVCGIGALKHKRAVATRYAKLAVRYTATLSSPTSTDGSNDFRNRT